jgi:6-phosphogluconolactonase
MRTISLLPLAAIAITEMFAANINAAEQPKPEKLWVFVGTYTGKLSKGIYRYEMDLATGKLSNGELAAEVASPSFLAIHPTSKFLYCVNEGGTIGGSKNGGVTGFALDAKTGKLTKINEQPAGGSSPCHITVDPKGKTVLIANYGGGSTNAYPIDAEGKLGAASAFIQHTGKGGAKGTTPPHAHSVNVSKDGRFAFVADAGIDQVLVYKLDSDTSTLTPNDPPYFAAARGAGPRHFAFHPSAPLAFVINESDLTLTSMSLDAAKGVLTKIQTVSTVPPDHKGGSTAEVVVHPSGKFVYGSNRGHDSIVGFKVNDKGEMTLIGHASEGVKEPRNFNIDPTGQYLVVGSQRANTIVVFKVDRETGALKPTEHKVEVGTPVCIKFLPIAK